MQIVLPGGSESVSVIQKENQAKQPTLSLGNVLQDIPHVP